MAKAKKDTRANTDYTLNPIKLNKRDGEYIESQLKRVRKSYEVGNNDLIKKKEKLERLLNT